MRTDYVIFWADQAHPVRILPMRFNGSELDLGSPASQRLNLYCDYLRKVFPGSRLTWEPSNDRKGSHAKQLASDLQEYRAWLAECNA